jgi:hypothetical protein
MYLPNGSWFGTAGSSSSSSSLCSMPSGTVSGTAGMCASSCEMRELDEFCSTRYRHTHPRSISTLTSCCCNSSSSRSTSSSSSAVRFPLRISSISYSQGIYVSAYRQIPNQGHMASQVSTYILILDCVGCIIHQLLHSFN